tara:strand:+ start:202 stop:645 length:444 start_codon:yes stop_codon:yes gene_type:complete
MIEGVKKIQLYTHKDKRGFFREIFRFKEQFPDDSIGQLSHSLVEKDVVKCWHGHVYQSQWNYVVAGKINVALYDNRKDSSDYKKIDNFTVGSNTHPIAYFFPPGVLHGYRCLEGPMHIVYVTSSTYDLDDEVRISNEKIQYPEFNEQ